MCLHERKKELEEQMKAENGEAEMERAEGLDYLFSLNMMSGGHLRR